MLHRLWALLPFLILLALGCSKPNPLVGKYKAQYVGTTSLDPNLQKLIDGTSVNLKDGGSFDMVLLAPQDGKWTEKAGIIELAPERMGNLDIPEGQRQTLRLQVNEGGKFLTFIGNDSVPSDVKLVKE